LKQPDGTDKQTDIQTERFQDKNKGKFIFSIVVPRGRNADLPSLADVLHYSLPKPKVVALFRYALFIVRLSMDLSIGPQKRGLCLKIYISQYAPPPRQPHALQIIWSTTVKLPEIFNFSLSFKGSVQRDGSGRNYYKRLCHGGFIEKSARPHPLRTL
jgi:hypothetical protein